MRNDDRCEYTSSRRAHRARTRVGIGVNARRQRFRCQRDRRAADVHHARYATRARLRRDESVDIVERIITVGAACGGTDGDESAGTDAE